MIAGMMVGDVIIQFKELEEDVSGGNFGEKEKLTVIMCELRDHYSVNQNNFDTELSNCKNLKVWGILQKLKYWRSN